MKEKKSHRDCSEGNCPFNKKGGCGLPQAVYQSIEAIKKWTGSMNDGDVVAWTAKDVRWFQVTVENILKKKTCIIPQKTKKQILRDINKTAKDIYESTDSSLRDAKYFLSEEYLINSGSKTS